MSIERKLQRIASNTENLEEKNAINRMLTTGYERNFAYHLACFGLKSEDLFGKQILDIGSGAGIFAKEAKEKGINVTPVDLNYKYESGRVYYKHEFLFQWLKKVMGGKKKNLPQAYAALAKDLPFKDETFDDLFYVYSAFNYARSGSEVTEILAEGLRVLKKGGKMFLYPTEYNKELGKSGIVSCWKSISGTELSRGFYSYLSQLEKRGRVKKEEGSPKFTHALRAKFGEDEPLKSFMKIEKVD